MDPNLINRRKAAAERHDAALERWPNRDHPDFIKELEGVVSELKEIAKEADATGGNRLERSRTWTYLGMAYFDLGTAYSKTNQVKKVDFLTESAIAYDRAESLLLGIGDPAQAAKINFNYANTLRGLSEGEDIKLLESAKGRYELALETFDFEAPQYAPQVTDALRTLEHQINLARLKFVMRKKISRFEELQKKIQQAGPGPNPEEEKEIQKEIKKVREEGPELSDVIDTINREVKDLLENLKKSVPANSVATIQDQLNRINKLFEETSAFLPTTETDSDVKIFSILMKRFEQEIQSGKISEVRKKALSQILEDLRDLINNKPEDLDEIMDWTGRIRILMKSMAFLLTKPSIGKPEPPAGSRASKVLELWYRMKINLITDINRPFRGSEENSQGINLLVKASKAEQEIYDAGSDDGSILSLESELLRSLALNVREFLLRNHLMLVHPYWGPKPAPREPNAIFFSGNNKSKHMISEICKKRHLHLLPTPSGVNFAQARWDQLQSSNVAMFDLTVPRGPELAAICYELGIARSLGKSVVIIKDKKQPLPFDVDVTPVKIAGAADDLESCAEGLDHALFIGPQSTGDSSVSETVAYALQYYSSGKYTFEIKKTLDFLDEAKDDAALTKSRLMILLGLLPFEVPMIIYPTWCPHYPKADEIHCFHVMPFSEDWSNQVSKMADEACKTANAFYIRGDKVSDPQIIRSIWEEICKSSHVLVDLTGFNPNVALELGIAHSIGRKTLIMAQPNTVNNLFPMISKTRIETYDLADRGRSLRDSVLRFVQS